MAEDDAFLSRWSRRKAEARRGDTPAPALEVPRETVPPAQVSPVVESASLGHPVEPAQRTEPTRTPPPPPTLADVVALGHDSDYSRFVAPGVDGEVKQAAMKKLFADPRFNVMDGLDVYIDDYSKFEPLPSSVLSQLAQSAFLGLIEETEETPASPHNAPAAAPPPTDAPPAVPDEDPDLRLQPLDAAGSGGAEPGAAEDPRRER